MAFMKLRDRRHESATMRHVHHAILFCLLFATGLAGCATTPVPEKAPIAEPENHEVDPRELAGRASNVTGFTNLVYAEETTKQFKINHDKIRITIMPQSPESARKEVQSFYAAYCEAENGQLITGLPVSRIPENLPAYIKPPYAQKFKKKYDLPTSVLWCQDKEDVYFGVEMKNQTGGDESPELTITIYTESFVEKHMLWTSEKDMISKIEREIEKDKQEMPYSLGVIEIPTVKLAAKASRPDSDGRQRLELSIENRGTTRLQIRMDTDNKFVARDGKSYGILWEMNKDGESIKATSSGEGCQLTNKNTLFIVNPGSKCTLSAPINVPGVNQLPLDGKILFDSFTFDMHRVSSYEDKTSPIVRSPQ